MVGNSWAVSKGVNLKAGEGANLAKQFKDPATVFAQGITIGGVKYMGIKGDERYSFSFSFYFFVSLSLWLFSFPHSRFHFISITCLIQHHRFFHHPHCANNGMIRSIYGKKGAGGVVNVKTAQAIVIGVYDDKLQPGNASNIAEKLADYLLENGY